MSELSYKELQEQGVFDVPYKAFEFMQSQQAKIDALQSYIDKSQRCLPYYLLGKESNENWIGGVQTKIVKDEVMIEELQARIDEALRWLSAIDTPNEAYQSIDNLMRILKGNKDEK